MRRNRWLYIAAGGMVVACGLGSRRYAAALPAFIADYAGDTLWALMAFITIAVAAPRWPTWRVAAAALGLSYAVEISQLYHAPWIDAVRSTPAGGLLLGYGFLWSDIVCYTVGAGCGAAIETNCLTTVRPRR